MPQHSEERFLLPTNCSLSELYAIAVLDFMNAISQELAPPDGYWDDIELSRLSGLSLHELDLALRWLNAHNDGWSYEGQLHDKPDNGHYIQ